MPHEIAVADVNIHPYILSVTTRDAGEDAKLLEELTYRTIATWLHIVKFLKQNVYKFEGGSVEQRYADEINKRLNTDAPKTEPFEFKETFGDSRVTVWDTYRGAEHPCFHLNSDDNPQVAIDTWLANQRGIQRAIEKFAPNASQSIQDTPPASATAGNAMFTHEPQERPATPKSAPNTNVTPNQAMEGAIVATRAPNPNSLDYADGQLVEFKINKIVLGTHPNSGSVIYSLWGDLGKKYALKTVYVMASNGTDKSYDYTAAAQTLESLGLTIPGKMQAEGNWKLVCKAANGGAKQYLNIVSLT